VKSKEIENSVKEKADADKIDKEKGKAKIIVTSDEKADAKPFLNHAARLLFIVMRIIIIIMFNTPSLPFTTLNCTHRG